VFISPPSNKIYQGIEQIQNLCREYFPCTLAWPQHLPTQTQPAESLGSTATALRRGQCRFSLSVKGLEERYIHT